MQTAQKLIGGVIILTAAYLLKAYYSQATSESLSWIIGPTAVLAEMFSSLSFVHEPGYGWVDVQKNVVIAPVCAGVNFLIIAFCMSSFQILWKTRSPRGLVSGVIIGSTASYLLTVIANAARIILSVLMFRLDFYTEWITPEMVHRITGIIVYYLLLCFYSGAVSYYFRTVDSSRPGLVGRVNRQAMLLAPLFWYVLFSVGIPLANHSLRNNPELFITHGMTVGLVTTIATLILYKALRLCGFVRSLKGESQCSSGQSSAQKLLASD